MSKPYECWIIEFRYGFSETGWVISYVFDEAYSSECAALKALPPNKDAWRVKKYVEVSA